MACIMDRAWTMKSLRFAVKVHSVDYGTKKHDKLFMTPTNRVERSYQVFEAYDFGAAKDIVLVVCFYDYWSGKPLPLYRPDENTFQNLFEPLEIIVDFIV